MARDYGKEYSEYHSKPTQKKRRAKRNNARREAIRTGKASKGDGTEVNHKVPLSKGGTNSKKNREVVSRKTNRKQGNKVKK